MLSITFSLLFLVSSSLSKTLCKGHDGFALSSPPALHLDNLRICLKCSSASTTRWQKHIWKANPSELIRWNSLLVEINLDNRRKGESLWGNCILFVQRGSLSVWNLEKRDFRDWGLYFSNVLTEKKTLLDDKIGYENATQFDRAIFL